MPNAISQNQDLMLKTRIMRRVYFYWFFKQVAPSLAIQLGALGLILAGVHEYVSVRFVSSNVSDAATSISSFSQYAVTAFSKTEFISRVLIGATVLLGFLILRDARRILRRLMTRQAVGAGLMPVKMSR